MTKGMVTEGILCQTEITTKVCGKMEKCTAKAYMCIKMGKFKGYFRMINLQDYKISENKL